MPTFKLNDFNPKFQEQIRRQLADDIRRASPKSTKQNGRSGCENIRVESTAECVGYCITLIQCRRRLLDGHDSMRFAVKPLVDCIAKFLGHTDDSNEKLVWQYQQLQTTGREGVLVHIEII